MEPRGRRREKGAGQSLLDRGPLQYNLSWYLWPVESSPVHSPRSHRSDPGVGGGFMGLNPGLSK